MSAWAKSFEYGRLDLGREISELEHLAHFDDFVVSRRTPRGPLDGFFPGLDLEQPEAADGLLGLSEGAIGDFWFAAGEGDAGTTRCRRMQAIERQEHAGLPQCFVVLPHLVY